MKHFSITPLIALTKVCKSYRIGKEAVPIFDNLDLSIDEGEFLAIMGPSGSGKSTLLNILSGIDQVDEGIVRAGETTLSDASEKDLTAWRAQHLGLVFQFYNLLPNLTAAQNIELPILTRPLSRAARKERVQIALDLVGLADRGKQRPGMMSGGQLQRVGIARAIVGDPSVLICDEPTGDLDRKSADDILQLLTFLNREQGKTIIMVTHDPAAAAYAHRTLHLDKGELVPNPLEMVQ
jgi:putative ABC transport system ATP-binding protein